MAEVETAVRAAPRTCDRCGRRGTRGFDGPSCADAAACDRRRERPAAAPPRGADRNRLPAWPVIAEVVRLARHRRLSLRELLGPELFGAYGNAQVAGTMSLVTLERFCDEVLGWHPRTLYGDAYDQAAYQPRATARERTRRQVPGGRRTRPGTAHLARGERPSEGPSRCS